MRIAIVAPPWAPIPPALYGGIEQAVDSEARALARAGHKVKLLATGESTCPVPREATLAAAEGYRIGSTVPELHHVLLAYQHVRADPDGFDVVHDHTVAGPFLAPALCSVPVVTTIHGPFNDELRALYARLDPAVALVAISHAQRRSAPEIPVAQVIHHGVDAERFPIGTGQGDSQGDYVLFLGRLAPEKGAHRAIEVARKAGVRLLLAGKARERPERDYLANRVTPLLGDDAVYLGEVDHEEKLRLLAGARATLFPIRWPEPFGLVMIESLACGTPVLAFGEGAVPEVIEHGDTGFVCADIGGMAEALARVDTLSRDRCRQAVPGPVSEDRMAAELLALFERLLSERG
ncbi:MAG: glycosyltransferase family 4 protein [Acidimicrobiales bacterium]